MIPATETENVTACLTYNGRLSHHIIHLIYVCRLACGVRTSRLFQRRPYRFTGVFKWRFRVKNAG